MLSLWFHDVMTWYADRTDLTIFDSWYTQNVYNKSKLNSLASLVFGYVLSLKSLHAEYSTELSSFGF